MHKTELLKRLVILRAKLFNLYESSIESKTFNNVKFFEVDDELSNIIKYAIGAVDSRPTNCRDRLREEGKAYPKSSCTACGTNITTGVKCLWNGS